ncbi:ATP-dependent zinc metalloprotease FtsH [Albimonas sp. CAU 1670]|uniref:ATP-dependent zinc metalloprotease FtsH n=1 Tax=Albimonas sp. CAU 1670 TaxID=3032599 RepID=UPI0023D9CF47|nr:ATP-dependent zinc metalloprotease FtsH [Albimonas sp. CAU 1670]MDF2231824.1 ATP-dependent zinc metalloprotease FtsH [Albimonas sp. CAU 1670]
MTRWNPTLVLQLVFALAFVVAVQAFVAGSREVEPIPYSDFRAALAAGEVTDLVVAGDDIRGSWRTPRDGATGFRTRRVDDAFAAELDAAGASYRAAPDASWLAALVSWVAPAAIFVGLWWLVLRRMAAGGGAGGGLGGLMSVGRSRAKVYVETETSVTFADVAGVDEAKEELQELVEFLRAPQEHAVLGARAPKGVLLLGPPGTGKTLLARAVAGEAGCPFFSISGSEFVEMFVGVGAARVRDLFEQARAKAPAIIFIDELDALGRARGAGPAFGGHDEREQTLNQLLTELDGFDASAGVVLLAATNRPEILDPALLRAGRFDRQILIDRPDRTGREAILTVHLGKAKLGADVDPAALAGLTTGFTGADLANLVNEAALLATRRRAQAVEMSDFTRAIERIVAGLEKRSRLMSPKERGIVAVHETGHALVALSLPGADRVHKISIIPRGVGALGYTIQRPTEDRWLMTRAELERKLAVLLGGRAAEEVVFGHRSTGAADDLGKATDVARAMAARYAMAEELGPVAWETDAPNLLGLPGEPSGRAPVSQAQAERLDAAVTEILTRAYATARTVLERRRAELDRVSAALLAHETLEEADLLALLDAPPPADPAETPGAVAASTEAPSAPDAEPEGRRDPSPLPPQGPNP